MSLQFFEYPFSSRARRFISCHPHPSIWVDESLQHGDGAKGVAEKPL